MAASGPVCVAYLALQAPRPGTAAYTHVHEIVQGLRREGFSADLARAVAALCAGEGPGDDFRERVRRIAEQQFSWNARSRHTAAFLHRLLAHST